MKVTMMETAVVLREAMVMAGPVTGGNTCNKVTGPPSSGGPPKSQKGAPRATLKV